MSVGDLGGQGYASIEVAAFGPAEIVQIHGTDKAAGTDVVRSTARRAGATNTELDGSHVIMIFQPEAVTEVILAAVKAVSPVSV